MRLDLAAGRAALTPERPAVYWEGRWHTYAEMNGRAERLAARLAEQGVTKGDRVSILAHNHLAHLDLILGTPKLGFVYTPLNYRLSAREQREIGRYLEPSVVFFDAANAAVAGEVASALGVPTVPLEGYEAWLAAAPAPPPSPTLTPEDTQMILLTGGTTGLPSGAVQPYRQGFYNAVNTVLSWGLREDDCTVQATPCFHAAVNALTVPPLHLGARVALQRTFEPGEYLRLLRETSATLLFMVPTMYGMLLEHPDFGGTDLRGVRWAISGGAPCPERVREAFAARGVPFKQGYGLTEAGVNCFAISVEEARERPTSVGKPVLHAEAKVCREDGSEVSGGEVGHLLLRGLHVFGGYFRRPEKTRAALKDGWLWTGDLARRDDEGFFYIAGRHKEMFISGGENVFPAEVEGALYTHPAVAECAVVGVPDARWGEVGLAALVLRPGASSSEAELRAHLKAHLAGYKVPKHLRFMARLPKSGAGKILKRELLEDFRASTSGER